VLLTPSKEIFSSKGPILQASCKILLEKLLQGVTNLLLFGMCIFS